MILLHRIVCVLQHGRCKHWNTVFSCLAFDSSLGFPGEGPFKLLTDFFSKMQPADKESSNEPTGWCSQAAEPISTQISHPLPPCELELHELEMAYAEEVLCSKCDEALHPFRWLCWTIQERSPFLVDIETEDNHIDSTHLVVLLFMPWVRISLL